MIYIYIYIYDIYIYINGIEESNLLDVDDRNGSILAIRLHPIESNA